MEECTRSHWSQDTKSRTIIILEGHIENITLKQPGVPLRKIIRSQNLAFCWLHCAAKPVSNGQGGPWSRRGMQGQQWWCEKEKQGLSGMLRGLFEDQEDTVWSLFSPSSPEGRPDSLPSLLLSPPSAPTHFSVPS